MATDSLLPRFTIGVVSRRTGISPLVLRAWERRYGVVEPGRTDTGRRQYSAADIEKLSLLKILTDSGHRIGDVANLPVTELRSLVREVPLPGPGMAPVRGATSDSDSVDRLLGLALEATAAMDNQTLKQVLEQASRDLSPVRVRRVLIQPLMVEIGERWSQGTMRIAHEHMATAVVNTFLAGLNARQSVAPGSPLLALATPSGDLHELGALLATARALEVGWDVLYLGPNLPAEEIASGIQARRPRGLYLSLVYPLGDDGIRQELSTLRRLVDPDFPILAGGRGADSYRETLLQLDMILVSDPSHFDNLLADLPLS
ncbi:hypothetical protein CO151_06580 [bacterium CG_4_9_14_3_um_filter_65_15]|nr:MAG: hypothetical protein CO151_06580 [bacterium CG_4_9_14_3_um_filter_65_15]